MQHASLAAGGRTRRGPNFTVSGGGGPLSWIFPVPAYFLQQVFLMPVYRNLRLSHFPYHSRRSNFSFSVGNIRCQRPNTLLLLQHEEASLLCSGVFTRKIVVPVRINFTVTDAKSLWQLTVRRKQYYLLCAVQCNVAAERRVVQYYSARECIYWRECRTLHAKRQ